MIDGYSGFERVGSGGFSTVYRAHQDRFNRLVAVKVLSVELLDDNAQRRFARECSIAGQLSAHPNIVTVLDSGLLDDGRPYIVTEYMSGGSLGQRLAERGPLGIDEAAEIGVKVAGALAAVHDAGILHRDIKPENILMSGYEEPALADFGISAVTAGRDATMGTDSLTPLHAPPEMLEGAPSTAAGDIYSLGSTIYALLAGRAPFQPTGPEGILSLMRRITTSPVPPITSSAIPASLTGVLETALAKDPAERFASATAMAEALQQVQVERGLHPTPIPRPQVAASTHPPSVPAGSGLDTGLPEPLPPPETVVRPRQPQPGPDARSAGTSDEAETVVRQRALGEADDAPKESADRFDQTRASTSQDGRRDDATDPRRGDDTAPESEATSPAADESPGEQGGDLSAEESAAIHAVDHHAVRPVRRRRAALLIVALGLACAVAGLTIWAARESGNDTNQSAENTATTSALPTTTSTPTPTADQIRASYPNGTWTTAASPTTCEGLEDCSVFGAGDTIVVQCYDVATVHSPEAEPSPCRVTGRENTSAPLVLGPDGRWLGSLTAPPSDTGCALQETVAITVQDAIWSSGAARFMPTSVHIEDQVRVSGCGGTQLSAQATWSFENAA